MPTSNDVASNEILWERVLSLLVVRFLKPVFFGDTVTVTYVISEIDEQRRRSLANIEIKNQNGDLVAVGKHITEWTLNVSQR